MSYPRPHLNAAGRRARKRTLARRDGRRCFYCREPFTADLRNATIDHVAPISLFVTWRTENLVLACRPCNTTKSNRLPLSMALLLCAQAADRDAGVTQVSTQVPHTVTPVVTAVTPWPVTPDWVLLARLAHANQSAYAATWAPDRSALPTAQRLMPDLPVRPDRSTHRSTPAYGADRDARSTGSEAGGLFPTLTIHPADRDAAKEAA
ncbi:HNH endonuclease [Streptomyces sp. NPDC057743]|uniref:HNH endonuclease n=1 Tax=Streptomyces sp. NPDC057743 TaxID=3346236 RepID=UPI0036953015